MFLKLFASAFFLIAAPSAVAPTAAPASAPLAAPAALVCQSVDSEPPLLPEDPAGCSDRGRSCSVGRNCCSGNCSKGTCK
jgi:hypothetical protein